MPDDHAPQPVSRETQATRQAFYDRMGSESLAPLWEVMKGLVPPEPRPSPAAHLWRYDAVRPYLMEAGQLLTAEEASDDCFLFCSSDRVAQEKLGLWREELHPG